MGALVRFFSVVKTLVVLLQVADSVEHFVTLVASELSHLVVDCVRALTSLGTVPLLLDSSCSVVGVVDVLGKDAVESVLGHGCVG